MRKEYDFSKAKRAHEVPHLNALRASVKRKKRISIMLDDEVIAGFRERAQATGVGYQTEINRVLHEALKADDKPLTIDAVRRVVREELRARKQA